MEFNQVHTTFHCLQPHVSLLSKIEGLTHQIDKMKADFLSEMNQALDKRGVGSESFFAQRQFRKALKISLTASW